MRVKESKLRRKHIEHLCKQEQCTIEDLLRDKRHLLSSKLVGQCQLMYHEQHHRYFWKDKIEVEQ